MIDDDDRDWRAEAESLSGDVIAALRERDQARGALAAAEHRVRQMREALIPQDEIERRVRAEAVNDIRDRLAIAALQTLLAAELATEEEEPIEVCAARLGVAAYAYADATMAARDRSGRRAALALALADAMVRREELEKAIEGDPDEDQAAEIKSASRAVDYAFAAVFVEWSRP